MAGQVTLPYQTIPPHPENSVLPEKRGFTIGKNVFDVEVKKTSERQQNFINRKEELVQNELSSRLFMGMKTKGENRLETLYTNCQKMVTLNRSIESNRALIQQALDEVLALDESCKNRVDYCVLLHCLRTKIEGAIEGDTLHYLMNKTPLETCICMLMLDHETHEYPTHKIVLTLDAMLSEQLDRIFPWFTHPLFSNLITTSFRWINPMLLSPHGLQLLKECHAPCADPVSTIQVAHIAQERQLKNILSMNEIELELIHMERRVECEYKSEVTYVLLLRLYDKIQKRNDLMLQNIWCQCVSKYLLKNTHTLTYQQVTDLSESLLHHLDIIENALEICALSSVCWLFKTIEKVLPREALSLHSPLLQEMKEFAIPEDLAKRRRIMMLFDLNPTASDLLYKSGYEVTYDGGVSQVEQRQLMLQCFVKSKNILLLPLINVDDIKALLISATEREIQSIFAEFQFAVNRIRHRNQQQISHQKAVILRSLMTLTKRRDNTLTFSLLKKIIRLDADIAFYHQMLKLSETGQDGDSNMMLNCLCFKSEELCRRFGYDYQILFDSSIFMSAERLRVEGIQPLLPELRKVLQKSSHQLSTRQFPILKALIHTLVEHITADFESMILSEWERLLSNKGVMCKAVELDISASIWFLSVSKLVCLNAVKASVLNMEWIQNTKKQFLIDLLSAYHIPFIVSANESVELESEASRGNPYAQCRLIDRCLKYPFNYTEKDIEICATYLLLPSVFQTHERLLYQGVVRLIGLGCEQDRKKGELFILMAIESVSIIPRVRYLLLSHLYQLFPEQQHLFQSILIQLASELCLTPHHQQEMRLFFTRDERFCILLVLKETENKIKHHSHQVNQALLCRKAAMTVFSEQELIGELNYLSKSRHLSFKTLKIKQILELLKFYQGKCYPNIETSLIVSLIRNIVPNEVRFPTIFALISLIDDASRQSAEIRTLSRKTGAKANEWLREMMLKKTSSRESIDCRLLYGFIKHITVTDETLDLVVFLIKSLKDETYLSLSIREVLFSNEKHTQLKRLTHHILTLVKILPSEFTLTSHDVTTLSFILIHLDHVLPEPLVNVLMQPRNIPIFEGWIQRERRLLPSQNLALFSHYLDTANPVKKWIAELIWSDRFTHSVLRHKVFCSLSPRTNSKSELRTRVELLIDHIGLALSERIEYFQMLALTEKRYLLKHHKIDFLSCTVHGHQLTPVTAQPQLYNVILERCPMPTNVSSSKAEHLLKKLLKEPKFSGFRNWYRHYLLAKHYQSAHFNKIREKLMEIAERSVQFPIDEWEGDTDRLLIEACYWQLQRES